MSLNGKIDNLSNLVVSKYTEEGIPLNDTISKIAGSEHFNENHIARLVEMSNKKTFLKIYPEKHSFEVATVPAVMKALDRQKEAVETHCMRLSGIAKRGEVGTQCRGGAGVGTDATNYKLLTLSRRDVPPGRLPRDPIGIPGTKEAANANAVIQNFPRKHGLLSLLSGQTKKAIEELAFAARQKRSEMLDCEDKLVDITKQAILRGSTFADLETYTLSTLDKNQKEASEVMGRVYGRIKNMPFVEKRASERGGRREPFVGESNLYTDMVETIIKNASEIPIIERSIKILHGKSVNR